MSVRELAGKRVTVWGLGLFGGGVAVARFLAEAGAEVTVIDAKSKEKLAPSLEALADLDLRYHFGAPHREEDLLGAELVIKSPAIPPRNEWLTRLAQAEVPWTTEIGLGLALVDVPYVAVTGSKGKTTTASLCGAMLAAGERRVLVAGNNERPLLEALRQEPELLVLEISSFMADALAHERASGVHFRAPEAVLFTSLCPEHLNWHPSLDHYYGAKLSLLELEPRQVIYPLFDEELAARVPAAAAAEVQRVGVRLGEPGEGEVGVVAGAACLQAAGERVQLFELDTLQLFGEHNRANALVAAAGAYALSQDLEALRAGAASFQAMEHRLQTVARRGELRFVDDSTATTPEAAIAALRAVPKPVVLLAGGSDKGADYAELGQVAAEEAAVVVCLGEVGERIAAAVAAAPGSAEVVRVSGGFEEAFAAALARCGAEGTLLLSPAAASYDMFANFKARGRRFAELSAAAESD